VIRRSLSVAIARAVEQCACTLVTPKKNSRNHTNLKSGGFTVKHRPPATAVGGMKCDKGTPTCLFCQRAQSVCLYSNVTTKELRQLNQGILSFDRRHKDVGRSDGGAPSRRRDASRALAGEEDHQDAKRQRLGNMIREEPRIDSATQSRTIAESSVRGVQSLTGAQPFAPHQQHQQPHVSLPGQPVSMTHTMIGYGAPQLRVRPPTPPLDLHPPRQSRSLPAGGPLHSVSSSRHSSSSGGTGSHRGVAWTS
jgi:hypothetical protein